MHMPSVTGNAVKDRHTDQCQICDHAVSRHNNIAYQSKQEVIKYHGRPPGCELSDKGCHAQFQGCQKTRSFAAI